MTMAQKPRALRAGDLIGVAAPAGPVDEERLYRGVAELEALGFAVRVAEGVLDRRGFTAGPLESRVAQLQALLTDGEIAAIACARGGAGAGRLLAGLDVSLLEKNRKPLLGYSDVTWLHLALGGLGISSLHGPMVARELAEGEAAYDRHGLWQFKWLSAVVAKDLTRHVFRATVRADYYAFRYTANRCPDLFLRGWGFRRCWFFDGQSGATLIAKDRVIGGLVPTIRTNRHFEPPFLSRFLRLRFG